MGDPTGPLAGLTVIELGGIGPAPFAGMLLADLGAEVIRLDRPSESGTPSPHPILHRGRRSITVDLKHPDGVATARALARGADAVIEGFRPGVTERLGLGPAVLLEDNPRLVYGRMTGWGQDGPLADEPGHDINFIALTGALDAIGTSDAPVVPLNLIGDMGGGGMLLAFGVLAAVTSARTTGRGQVVDAAMTDGTAALLAMVHGFRNDGRWRDERCANGIDGGSPVYRTYRCSDGRHIALGVGDRHAFRALVGAIGADGRPEFADHTDREHWPAMRAALEELFAGAPRDHWERELAGVGACVSPVLGLGEAPSHPHNVARGTFLTEPGGAIQPAPVPRFSGTPAGRPCPAPHIGADTDRVLADLGVEGDEISRLRASGSVG